MGAIKRFFKGFKKFHKKHGGVLTFFLVFQIVVFSFVISGVIFDRISHTIQIIYSMILEVVLLNKLFTGE